MPVETFVAAPETLLVPVGRPVPEFFTVPRTLAEARAYAAASPSEVGEEPRALALLIHSGDLVALDPWRTTDDIVDALFDLTLTTTQPEPASLDEAFWASDGTPVACSHRVASLLWGPEAYRTVGEWLAAPANDDIGHFDLVDELVAALPHLLASGARLGHPPVSDETGSRPGI